MKIIDFVRGTNLRNPGKVVANTFVSLSTNFAVLDSPPMAIVSFNCSYIMVRKTGTDLKCNTVTERDGVPTDFQVVFPRSANWVA